MENIIQQINESDTFVRILEVGAGVPIASEIFNYPGASRTIYSSESYYSRDSFNSIFGENKYRAVSAEKLKSINDNIGVCKDLCKDIYNTVLSTTFQIETTIGKSTHGWISINIRNESIRYYHISLHYPNSRIEYIKEIGRIGVLLLHAKNKLVPENCNVDIVLDENLKPLYKETLEFLSKSENVVSIFSNQTIDRLESITRDVDTLVVYKGSFNPPTISHQEVMVESMRLYENPKGVFCISYNTYQKGFQTVESFLDRIYLLNKMGWDVMILSKPLFKDNYDLIRLKYSGKIVFPQGIDTINRMVGSYINDNLFDIEQLQNDFINTDFLIFNREGELMNPLVEDSLVSSGVVKLVNSQHIDISSTKIRDLINGGEFEKIKGLVPIEIYEKLITQKF
jgi:nicotinic acid mononucleotide adenylyltransferase